MASDRTVEEFNGSLADTGDENGNEAKLTLERKLVSILVKTNESLTAQLADSNYKRDAEVAELKAKLSVANEKITSMEDSSVHVEKKMVEVKQKNSDLHGQLSALQDRVKQLVAALWKSEGETNQLETDLRDTRERLRKTKEEIKRFEADIRKWEEEVEDLKQFNANVKTVKEHRIIVLTTENKTLTERLSVAQKEAEVRGLRMADLEALVRDLRIQVGILELE